MTQAETTGPASGPGNTLRGVLWAALSVAIFSGWFVVTRFSVAQAGGVSTLTVWDITVLRFGVGAVILLPVLLAPWLIRGRRRLPPGAGREGLLFAVLWGAPFVLLIALGLQLTSAGRAAAVTPTMMPVFAGLFGWVLLGDRPGRLRLAGYAAIAAGLLGLIMAGAGLHGMRAVAGFAAMLGAAALWAIYTLRFRRSGLTALQSAALICVWSALLVVPGYLILGLGQLQAAPLQEVLVQAGYQGVLMSVVAVITFNRAIALLGPAAATAMIALIPVTASLLAFLVLGETLNPVEIAAVLVIVAGVLLASRSSVSGTTADLSSPRPRTEASR